MLFGCTIRDEITRLDRHVVSLSHRNEDLEKRVSALEKSKNILQDENTKLRNENANLGKKLETYEDAQKQAEAELREQFAGLRVTNTRLREEIQNLLGRAEMSEHLLKQRTRDTSDLSTEWEGRFTKLEDLIESNRKQIVRFEEFLHLESSDIKTPVKTAPEQKIETLGEDELYKLAKQSFDAKEYEKAREAFQKLIDQYPKSKNADNAQFWIGEIYYREKWYEKSILEYQKVIEKYPQGNKVPASLLKQGLAFFNIDDKANARLILKELVRKYPKSSEAAIARKKLEGLN